MSAPPLPSPPDRDRVLRHLTRVRWVALIDALLLIPLVVAALTHQESVVDVLGPLHGFGFVLMIVLVVTGVGQGLWGWWFPAIVVVTAGPPGSLFGDVRIRRRLREDAPAG